MVEVDLLVVEVPIVVVVVVFVVVVVEVILGQAIEVEEHVKEGAL